MSEYGNDFGLAYWEGALSACQDEVHVLEGAVGMELGKSRMSSRVRQCAALLDRAKQQEQRIRDLEEAVRLALDLSENGLIDYQEYGLTCHDDIEQKYRNALEPTR